MPRNAPRHAMHGHRDAVRLALLTRLLGAACLAAVAAAPAAAAAPAGAPPPVSASPQAPPPSWASRCRTPW